MILQDIAGYCRISGKEVWFIGSVQWCHWFCYLYSLISKGNLDCKALKGTLDLVFRHRQTQLTSPILPQLDKMKDLQKLWSVYQSNQKVKGYLPISIDEIVDELNKWLAANL